MTGRSPAGPVRAHVREVLTRTGMSPTRYARAAGVDPATVLRVLNDTTVDVAEVTSQKLMSVTGAEHVTGLVSAGPAREHLRGLLAAGWTVHDVALASNVADPTLDAILYRPRKVTSHTAVAILAVTEDQLAHATGRAGREQLRAQAGVVASALGMSELAARAGVKRDTVSGFVTGARTPTQTTVDKIGGAVAALLPRATTLPSRDAAAERVLFLRKSTAVSVLASAVGVSESALRRFIQGGQGSPDLWEAIMAVTPTMLAQDNPDLIGFVDATATRRRAQALAADGWPLTRYITGREGTPGSPKIVRAATVTLRTHTQIANLYATHEGRRGPSKRAATFAARAHWVGADAWLLSDLTDPDTIPRPSWLPEDIATHEAASALEHIHAGYTTHKTARLTGVRRHYVERLVTELGPWWEQDRWCAAGHPHGRDGNT